MAKKIMKLLRKIIVSVFLIYSFNLLSGPLNIIIPLNLYTIGTVAILGIPSFLSLIAIFLIAY